VQILKKRKEENKDTDWLEKKNLSGQHQSFQRSRAVELSVTGMILRLPKIAESHREKKAETTGRP